MEFAQIFPFTDFDTAKEKNMLSVSKISPEDVKFTHYWLLEKIRGRVFLRPYEECINIFRLGYNPIHAGQMRFVQKLPSGNKLTQISTAYGAKYSYSVQGIVENPNGELLRAYFGIEQKGDWKFITSKDINEVSTFVNNMSDIMQGCNRLF